MTHQADINDRQKQYYVQAILYSYTLYHNLLLQPFYSLFSDLLRPRETGQAPRGGLPLQAEAILHHCGLTGSAVIEVYLESFLFCGVFVERMD